MNRFCTLIIAFVFSYATRLHAQQGVIDSSFGTDGCVATFFGDGDCIAYGVALTSTGKIITGGYAGNAMLVARYTANGTVDSTFATNGADMPTFGWTGDCLGQALAIQNDGKIVLAGLGATPNLEYFSVARFKSNGFPDSTFGVNGQASTDFGAQSLFGGAKAVVIQPDGKIIAGGYSHSGYCALVRLDTTGVIDSSFGVNGIALPAGPPGGISAMILQPDGKILVGGYQDENPFVVVRLLNNGTADSTFGTNGITDSLFNSNGGVTGLALQPNGDIVAVGRWFNLSDSVSFAIARFDSTGHADNTFGTDGWSNFNFGASNGQLNGVVIQPDGRIIGAGSSGPIFGECTLVRYNYDGSPDSTFATNGIAQTSLAGVNPGGALGAFNTVILEPNNDILAAGNAIFGTGSGVAIVRYLNNLTLGVLNLSSPSKQLLVYPNPINQNTVLSYELSSAQQITIRLTDAEGRIVSTLMNNEWQQPGFYHQTISMPDYLAHGTYFIMLSSPNGRQAVEVVK